MINALESSSTRPYLIRALYEWCTDNGFTPYVAVQVDDTVQVPREYVKNGEIVLNISFDATSSLKLGNDFIEFKARFAGSAREISVPVGRVIAIYARENGQGMAFPAPAPAGGRPRATAWCFPECAVAPGPGAHAACAMPRAAPKAMPARSFTWSRVKTADETVDADAGSPTDPVDEPPRPPAGGGSRPSLKRVK
jgi:stringent starvation protein B